METTSNPVIEDSIEIAADAEQVWAMVREPGWWINDGAWTPHEIEHRDDGLVLVTDPVHGTFPLVVVEERPPAYVAFRWLARGDDPSPDGPGTLTEFWIEPGDGGVRVRVRESGFETLGESDEQLRATVADNTSGWATELVVLRDHASS